MEIDKLFIPENTDLNNITLNTNNSENIVTSKKTFNSNSNFRSILKTSIDEQKNLQILIKNALPIDFLFEANGPEINLLRKSLETTTDLRGREIIERKIEKLFPKPLQQYVIIIDNLLKTAELNELALGASNDKIFLFNGEFWELIPLKNFEGFLGEFSEKVGLNRLEADQFKVKELLLKQFMSSGYMPNFNDKGNIARIPFDNGTLVFDDGNVKLSNFDKNHFLTYKLSFSYDVNADAPQFKKFLDRVLPDKTAQNLMFEFFGSIFLKKKHEKILLLYGSGKNGKSVLHDILHALLGTSNMTSFSLASLIEPKSQSRMHLENKLLNFSSEIGSIKSSDVDMIKKLASMEPIEVKELYSNPYTITNYARLAFNCNVLPKAGENSDGFHRRFFVIHFGETITDEEMDIELASKIISKELPGIFNMVIDGMKSFYEHGFTYSKSVADQSENYRRDINSVLTFIDEMQYIPSARRSIALTTLYQEYKEYCIQNGFQCCNKNNFSSQLRDAKFQITRSTNGYYHVYFDRLLEGIDDSSIVLDPKTIIDI
ncbi:DNA primase family protein [Flavobacterium hydrophilum]|uniref:DNA primase n=1 Tax=Flavobacterium hydrophilum TaxID=2211445 RepID=A0A2V4C143_9FLAO|nr:DNA primase family protein [Flavobacterium hydrophilum]PXY44717.1 DNA primase [Flavobacterium hydrophilum]